jgi:hypothetical protein
MGLVDPDPDPDRQISSVVDPNADRDPEKNHSGSGQLRIRNEFEKTILKIR